MLLDTLLALPGSFELQAPVALWLAIGLGGSLAGAIAVHLDNRRFQRAAVGVPAAAVTPPLTTAAVALSEAEPVAA